MTRVNVRYKPNHREMAKFMLSDQARRPAIDAAKDIVNALSGVVRRGSGAPGPEGRLADSYEVNENAEPVAIDGNPRAGAEVYSSHPGAAPEEFGGKNQTAKHWLSNVASAWHVPRKGRGE